MHNTTKTNLLLAASAAFILAIGMFIGVKMSGGDSNYSGIPFMSKRTDKVQQIIHLIQRKYVDSVDISRLEKLAIEQILQGLDPHTEYIEAAQFTLVSQSLEGNFDGIGVEIHFSNDTLLFVNVVKGGPAENAGLKSGDKVIAINGEEFKGKEYTSTDIVSKLRGPGGTKVSVDVIEKNGNGRKTFEITRGKIPLNSVDAAYMINESIGYIRINKFAATTHQEFLVAFAQLADEGLNSLILDLRGNGGGYLAAATALADEFLPNNQLITYTMGLNNPREDYVATSNGEFEKGKLVVLVDENSASASEVLAGALQDTDRGTIIGRRTFGKGLVQEQIKFGDGSALRLTIARYYTPLGRSIQKSYLAGKENYRNELNTRLQLGELYSSDSTFKNVDTVKFITPSGKILYGSGGIMPDYLVSIDTSGYSRFFTQIITTSVLSDFAYRIAEMDTEQLKRFKNPNDYVINYRISDNQYQQFIRFAEAKNIKVSFAESKKSEALIKRQMKALIARRMWGDAGYFRVLNHQDATLLKAVDVLTGK